MKLLLCSLSPTNSHLPPMCDYPTIESIPQEAIKHAAKMYTAYIGALRVPYIHDENHGIDILLRLDKYIYDLVQPVVWVKLDDLVKQRSRGTKFGEQQLLDPTKRSLMERMTGFGPLLDLSNSSNRPRTPSTPSISRTSSPTTSTSETPMGPSMLNSPTPSFVFLTERTRGGHQTIPPRSSHSREPPSAPAAILGPVRTDRSQSRNIRGRTDQHNGGSGGLRLKITP